MKEWEFRNLSTEGELEDLSAEQEMGVDLYRRALETAMESSVPNPRFSNYYVRESVGSEAGLVPAGNIEYGLCQALHGEESAVAALRSVRARNPREKLVLAAISEVEGKIANPCGNCRDIMRDELGNLEIITGSPQGGIAVVASIARFLFENPSRVDPERGPSRYEIRNTIRMGEFFTVDPYSPENVMPERKYSSLIVTKNKDYYGARDVMCDYHPIYALMDAVRQARRNRDPYVDRVIIVCENDTDIPPYVMYKDRQHLLELNLQQEILEGREINPPVFLITYSKPEYILGVWKTSIKQWLPFPFSSRNFGNEFMEYLKSYFEKQDKLKD